MNILSKHFHLPRIPARLSAAPILTAMFSILASPSQTPTAGAPVPTKSPLTARSNTSAIFDTLSIEDFFRLMQEGQKPSAPKALELEANLQSDPSDLPSRLRLLGQRKRGEKMPPEAVELLLGIIKHNPRASGTGPFCVVLSVLYDHQAMRAAIALWEKLIEVNPTDAAILGNAAQWFEHFAMIEPDRRPRVRPLFEQARSLQPTNPFWAEGLGGAWLAEANSLKPPQSTLAARNAITQFDAAYNLLNATKRRTYRPSNRNYLAILAEASLLAEDPEKAKGFAIDLLNTLDEKVETWDYGNLIYTYNVFLGKIALKEGKIHEASDYLVAAGKTPGSPQLNSLGPNFTLARQLVEKGEFDPVIDFLDLVARFWANPEKESYPAYRDQKTKNLQELNSWKQQIRAGHVPDGRAWH